MDETRYSISETGKLVGVESHVLRYWEEELELQIPRNGKDHRYYTEQNVALFQKVKELKEKGYQLKAIKMVINKMMEGASGEEVDKLLEQEAFQIVQNGISGQEEDALTAPGEQEVVISQEKLEQFQQLMNHVIGNAMQANYEALAAQLSDRMVQELEYMMRINDEKEEERFRQLDEALRSYQKENRGRAEAAATRIPFFKKRHRK